ncbi:MBL fold metallo-hydrolase [Shewanella litorisediminis]|uniref:beta-lactamase n=1 Tax=Shewanella litorisediminis TaxID=1173586 RepID=A0ABX7G6Z3_9GAMM|nr:MBL fold metallo-hydrolase [Shewanella litorisediminis]MCL2916692.1 MBL fold metallo-hydrolase [Shewanella litorisediminis]QRH03134.1 MBL fold metallo-hydrolase [Shewanella litorisediminis]
MNKLPLIMLLCCSAAMSADDKFAAVEIKSTHLKDSAWMFEGAGGNIGVSSGDDGLLIIDDQFAPLADKITAALAQTPGAKAAPMPRYIINTHYHGDHTGGNAHFGAQGTVMAHDNVLQRLQKDEKFPVEGLPVITYDRGISIRFNGDNLKITHLGPGHTDGDSVVHWQKANVVHMGDLFFKDRFPFIDLKGGGNVIGYRDNVAAILQIIDNDTKVIPGHGELASKDDLLKFKHMLDDSINWAKEALNQGKSLEQMTSEGLAEKYKSWSWSFINEEKWIATLYEGLKSS